MAMLKKMLELFREPTEASHGGRSMSEGTGALEFKQVALSYATQRPILRDVSFKVSAGRTLGIVGSSGAGKSTIVRLLVRLYEPDQGTILMDGVPVSELSLQELRRLIAVVPQDTALFNDTIRYNIAIGRPTSTQEEIEHAARLAQLHDFIMRLPEGYDTRVGERGVKLSGGERQRISIARAVLKHPRMYVFDEATSSLDSHTERGILSSIQEISKSSTTLIIAHRLSTVVHADNIIVLDKGTVVEQGNHVQLLERDGLYASLWQAQQQEERQRRQSEGAPRAGYSADASLDPRSSEAT
jgi:ABC-type multidrug transport system fused ATPase/permease subunit